jgi:hypothetical protein
MRINGLDLIKDRKNAARSQADPGDHDPRVCGRFPATANEEAF